LGRDVNTAIEPARAADLGAEAGVRLSVRGGKGERIRVLPRHRVGGRLVAGGRPRAAPPGQAEGEENGSECVEQNGAAGKRKREGRLVCK